MHALLLAGDPALLRQSDGDVRWVHGEILR